MKTVTVDQCTAWGQHTKRTTVQAEVRQVDNTHLIGAAFMLQIPRADRDGASEQRLMQGANIIVYDERISVEGFVGALGNGRFDPERFARERWEWATA